MLNRSFTLPWLSFLATTLPAQNQIFYNPDGERLSFEKKNQKPLLLIMEDLDGDGDIDIVVANGKHWPDQMKFS
ncbi:MAG: hypothetical protein R2769_04995 [Saprospiraceae bacterium]